MTAPYFEPTAARVQLMQDIKAGLVRWYRWVDPWACQIRTDRKVTARVQALRTAGLAEVEVDPEYSDASWSRVVPTGDGQIWLAEHTGMCVRCLTTASTGECCSSHSKKLCHACYRRTHFSEVCVVGCALCIAEGLPYGTERLTEKADSVSANIAGFVTGVAWGPAADGTGEWFVRPAEGDAFRVADKAAAVESLLGLKLPARRLAEHGGAS